MEQGLPFRERFFRWCMFGAALIIGGVVIYFFSAYMVGLSIALSNSGLRPFYQESVRAMWLAFCAQLAILSIILLIAAFNPRGLSRRFVSLLAVMPLLAALLLFTFSAGSVSSYGGIPLMVATILLALAALTWPQKIEGDTNGDATTLSSRAPGSPMP